MSTPATTAAASPSRPHPRAWQAPFLSALMLVCSLAPAAERRADPVPPRFELKRVEPLPHTDAGRFSVLSQAKASATAPRFQLLGAKSAQAGSACEQVDALFLDGFED